MSQTGTATGDDAAAETGGDINTYDLFPYESHSFAMSHPHHAAAVAALFGVEAPPVDRCRVLEMGCAAGGNIIPMAFSLPASEFVGVDLSARQIERGHKTIADLGLRNIQLLHKSIEDIGPDSGTFDYIIAHGVYSWVPAAVREKIVSVCKKNLTPNGIAHISYNTYPGWHMPQAVREMMVYHTTAFKDPVMQVQQARALLRFLHEATESSKSAYSRFVQEELEKLNKSDDYYIFHEHLEKVNHPVYFHEFVQSADRHGLQYLADAELSTVLVANFPEKIAAQLRTARNIVQQEQYIDFLQNRRFRKSLLCHAEQKVQRPLRPQRISDLFVRAIARPKSDTWRKTLSDEIVLVRPRGYEFTFALPPVLRATLPVLWARAPEAVPFADLLAAARAECGESEEGTDSGSAMPLEDRLAYEFVRLYLDEIIWFYKHAPEIVRGAGNQPKVTALTRYHAEQFGHATNQWHEYVWLDAFERELIRLLDGSRNKAAIIAAMVTKVKEAHAAAKKTRQEVPAGFPTVANARVQIELSLNRLARRALFVP